VSSLIGVVALGRKNYLFAGSNAGGERAAAMYTIVQTAKLNDRNPEAYLRDILSRLRVRTSRSFLGSP